MQRSFWSRPALLLWRIVASHSCTLFSIFSYTQNYPAQSIVNPTIPTRWAKDDLASYESIIYNSLPSIEGKAKVILNLTNRKSVWSRVLPITGLLPIFFIIDLCHPIFIKSIQFNFYLERSWCVQHSWKTKVILFSSSFEKPSRLTGKQNLLSRIYCGIFFC